MFFQQKAIATAFSLVLNLLLTQTHSDASTTLLVQSTSTNESGIVEGQLIYPSDYTPAQKICAEELLTNQSYCTETEQNQTSYQIQLPPGVYYVYALRCTETYASNTVCQNGYLEKKAYYTNLSVCGFSYQCSQIVSGDRIPIKVKPGDNFSDIIPDWYSY